MKGFGGPRVLALSALLIALATSVLALGALTSQASAAALDRPMLRPTAQCVGVPEVTEWRGRFGRLNIEERYNYYCGPTYTYTPEWFAAHVTVHPDWYTVYTEEPTTCTAYHFAFENRWYCYTGP